MAKGKDVITVEMVLGRDTKRTWVFKADDTAAITSLYVQKEAYDGEAPKKVTVTVTPVA